MRFGPVPIAEAAGAILAHSEPTAQLKKGHRLSAGDIDALRAVGIDEVTVARLEPGDMAEDLAANRIGRALGGAFTRASDAFTGRANLYSLKSGLARIDVTAINVLNTIHESITVATLSPFDPVFEGAMLATIKIIPYAAPEWAVSKAESVAIRCVEVAPFTPKRVTLISTQTPSFKRSLLAKNAQVTHDRIAALGSTLAQHIVCRHSADGIANALREASGDLILLFGATANADRQDVVPGGIALAGGAVDHVGMPVDPGNLLVLGSLRSVPVVGLPGCARSPKRNGFDFVLERLCADIPVNGHDIMGMGVGGLLKEIPVRGLPRDREAIRPSDAPHRVAAIVLAAGHSSRMGANKLLMDIAGSPVLSHTLRASASAPISDSVVVTGHESDRVSALVPPDRRTVHNPLYQTGMASSLKLGLSALPPNCDAALVVLGDMPAVRPSDIAAIAAAFNPDEGRELIVPTYRGKRGHPVLFGRRFWPAMMDATGDQGARQVLVDNADAVCEVAIDHPGVVMDADTPEALAALRALMDQ